jgi:spore germination protein YaaH
VRYAGGIKSPIVTDLLKGDQVIVLEQGEHWLKVLTQNGFVGWVKSNRMTEPVTVNQEHEDFTPVAYPSIKMDDKVSLIWHMVTTTGDNKAFPDATASMTGINVISPTWFSLTDNEGNVESLGSKTYVEEAHNKGLQVWGLVDDFSPDMDNSVMLSSTAARRNCISQLIGYARTLGMDGINIDFEHIDPDDAYTYTEFVRELSIACRSHSLVLSVDTYPPYDFNAYLNRKEIAAVSDYLINMGYDEHYVGSESAGSVASFGYEARALSTLLQSGIPADKLISAIPFYTRIWYTSTDEAGTAYINSEELSMNAVSATLESWSLTPQWDPSTAQNYISWYTDDGVLCEIWIEDADSLLRKALLVSSNDLAGCAIWALGFQDDSVWKVVSENISLPKEEAATLLSQLQELDQAEAQKEVPDTEVPGTESE